MTRQTSHQRSNVPTRLPRRRSEGWPLRAHSRGGGAGAAALFLALLLLSSLARAAGEPSQPERRATLGGFVEDDVGVLLMAGGVGLFAGPSYGPFRAGVGYYRFDSPYRKLSGAPEGFELSVRHIVSVDATWHILEDRVEGPYVRLMGQWKRQRVENLDNGARKHLDSVLLGPELGWAWRVHSGLYLAPRLGALYYLKRPQGPDNAPVQVGGKPYDNERHHYWDLFATLGAGYAF